MVHLLMLVPLVSGSLKAFMDVKVFNLLAMSNAAKDLIDTLGQDHKVVNLQFSVAVWGILRINTFAENHCCKVSVKEK